MIIGYIWIEKDLHIRQNSSPSRARLILVVWEKDREGVGKVPENRFRIPEVVSHKTASALGAKGPTGLKSSETSSKHTFYRTGDKPTKKASKL